MAIQLPNGKITRTLPEQVGFNTSKIEEIIQFLNESGLKDLVINLEAMPGVLSADQYLIAEQSPSYIVYDGAVFYKLAEDSAYIDYVLLMDSVSVDSSIIVSTYRIRITRNSLTYDIGSVNLFETYNKSQIDSALSALNNAKANLSGANFTGPITGPSIIEDMEGYAVFDITTSIAVNVVYCGIVKNGNKITFVIFGDYTYAAGDNAQRLLKITIPSSIGAKLYPYTVGVETTILSHEKLNFSSSTSMSNDLYQATFDFQKMSNTLLYVNFRRLGNASLTDGSTYYFRIEQTFLLSDNLAE